MSWLDRRRPKKQHKPFKPEPEFVSFNERLKELERQDKLDAYMNAWIQYERDRGDQE